MALPDRYELRVGDEERSAVIEQLRLHTAAGRLTMDEFEERTERALAARIVGDLVPLTADLPAVRPSQKGPPVRRPLPRTPRPVDTWDVLFRLHVGIWAVLVAFFVLIWLLAGAGYFWPAWPALGIGLSVGIHAAVRKAVRG